MAKLEKTITAIFMVPTLKIPKEKLIENDYLNGYSKDAMKGDEYKDAIFLLFRPKNIEKFREFLEEEYERTKDIIEDYDYPEGFVVVVYKLKEEFKEDFDFIRRGKYSYTSKKFQEMFPEDVQIIVGGVSKTVKSIQVRIFKKSEELRKHWEEKLGEELGTHVELWEGFHEKNEVLTEEKLKEYIS